ncbi:MAG TPA: HupE/UreJ family protein [Anaeromyxobacteraceae bacterium]|nr:HupE/UreJ family protein [Anaeromyxobacteraceae bacterium]
MTRVRLAAAAGAALLAPAVANAHLMNSGFGPFYDGLAHPFLAPDDLLPIVALGLLGGLAGPACGRRVLLALPLAWMVGMAAGAAVGLPAAPAWWSSALTAALGALVAADRRWPPAAVTALAALAGATHGLGNGRELSGVNGGLLAMAGIACALLTVTALVGGQAASLRAHWARVAARVAGSWIAGIGLLMLGWTFR